METVHVRVGPIEQLQRCMGLDDALVVFRAGDDSEGNIGNVFGQSGDAGVDPGGLGKRNRKVVAPSVSSRPASQARAQAEPERCAFGVVSRFQMDLMAECKFILIK